MLDTKMLIVDDDTNICDLLKRYFENEGYSVKTANNGADGVSFFKVYDPDIVLLDIMLPKQDGWQVCREIREVSSKPIIMITAKDEVFDKVYAFIGKAVQTIGTETMHLFQVLLRIGYLCFALDE